MDIVVVEPAVVPDEAESFSVPMRDGVALATDVYGAAEESAVVVLVRLPYDKNGAYCFMDEIAQQFVEHGYVVVVQDVRGKFRSGGRTQFGINEVSDGYDTIDWIVAQPWCNGSVVMWGDSYFGMTQLAAVASGHPSLRAIVPRVTGTQLGTVMSYSARALFPEPSSRREYFAMHYVGVNSYYWPIDWTARPLQNEFEKFFDQLGTRSEDYDVELEAPSSRFGLSLDQLVRAEPVPTLYTVGLFDNCAPWSWYDVDALLSEPAWADSLYLRIEAIDHENNRFADLPISSPNDASAIEVRRLHIARMVAPAVEFFASQLDSSRPPPARVTYEVCNETVRRSDSWPPADSEARTWFVASTDDERVGVFAPEPADDPSQQLAWRSNGEDLVPSIAENPFNLLAELRDLAADSVRADVARVDGEKLDEPLTIVGPVDVVGRLTADKGSVDLYGRLLDVAPDGSASLITRGAVRLTALDEDPAFVLRLMPTAYRLEPGHSPRLTLASSDFPEFMFNVGDGSDAWTAGAVPSGTTTIALGGRGGLTMTTEVLPG